MKALPTPKTRDLGIGDLTVKRIGPHDREEDERKRVGG